MPRPIAQTWRIALVIAGMAFGDACAAGRPNFVVIFTDDLGDDDQVGKNLRFLVRWTFARRSRLFQLLVSISK